MTVLVIASVGLGLIGAAVFTYCVGSAVVFAAASEQPKKGIAKYRKWARFAVVTYLAGKAMARRALKKRGTKCWFVWEIGKSYGFDDIKYEPWYK